MTHLAAIRTFTAAMKYVRCQSHICHIGLIPHICVLRSTKHGVRLGSQSYHYCRTRGQIQQYSNDSEQGSSKRHGVSRFIRRPIHVETSRILYNGHALP
jgi:hypothetical protein